MRRGKAEAQFKECKVPVGKKCQKETKIPKQTKVATSSELFEWKK